MDRYTEIKKLIDRIAYKTEGITSLQIKEAYKRYGDDPRDIDEIEKELLELSAQITEMYNNRPKPREDISDDEMFVKITGELEIKANQDKIAELYNKSGNLNTLSSLIGEVYLYHFIHRDGYNFDEYFKRIIELYPKQLSKEDFDKARTELLIESIKDRLGITNIDMTTEEDNKVTDYFINNYIDNGFVAHSFNGAFKDSILENGLSTEPTVRAWDNEEVTRVGEMLKKHGAKYALGGYMHYNGKGIYYEHDMDRIYMHSIESPEWFNVFTSSDHIMDLSKAEKNPFVLRDYDACRKNVEDLTINADLSPDERKETIRLFEKTFYQTSNPDLYVAFIPRKEIGKDHLDKESTAFETIYSAITDKKQEYKEHVRNHTNSNILKEKLKINKLPRATTFINEKDIKYHRETKEELYDKKRLQEQDKHVEQVKKELKEYKQKEAEKKVDRIGDDKTVPRDVRIAKLKSMRSNVVYKGPKKSELHRMLDSNRVNHQQIKENVSTAQKVMVKTNNTPNNNSGFADSILIIAISIMTLITSILLYLAK